MNKYQKLNDRITRALETISDKFQEATLEEKLVIAQAELECSRAIAELMQTDRQEKKEEYI